MQDIVIADGKVSSKLVEVLKEVIADVTPDKYEAAVFAALALAKAVLVALKA